MFEQLCEFKYYDHTAEIRADDKKLWWRPA